MRPEETGFVVLPTSATGLVAAVVAGFGAASTGGSGFAALGGIGVGDPAPGSVVATAVARIFEATGSKLDSEFMEIEHR